MTSSNIFRDTNPLQPSWLSGPPSGQGACNGARTRDGRVLADLRVDSPPTAQQEEEKEEEEEEKEDDNKEEEERQDEEK
ncbi:hypothetical protein PoB_002335800 [Plakobranchus ocellatus]|uniref:Uncharacterized protein n=1 Tax=Plakobranchus ocellatus TaxID=259542 RepID=A0AAV3ZQL8_9GAST|nr:hypothetical protein PoB_002335800 [Plakobranchus ocellatus]